MEHERVIGAFGTITKVLIQGLEDCLNYSVVEIGKNTEKSSGDLRRLAVTQALVQNHQLTLL